MKGGVIRKNLEGSGGRRDLCQEESSVHPSGSSVRTAVCEKRDDLEDNKSLLWQGQVPVKDERAEGRLGTRGLWASSGSSAGVTAAAAVTEPPTVGQVGGGAVSQVETAGKGGAASWHSLAMP